MLLTKYIQVKITKANYEYYKSFGYDVDSNKYIVISIGHLPLGSNKKVDVRCDNCGIEYELSYCDYTKRNGKPLYCKRCKYIGAKETNLKRYGCENVFQVKEFQEKQKETVNRVYGCDNVFQNEKIKEKTKETMLEKYGADHPMRVEDIAKRVKIHGNQTMSENGTQSCSGQQRHLHEIYGGELNYLFESFWLDIYFQGQNIYCEYQGSGHDISVKYKKISREEFVQKEAIRYNILKTKGLKEIEIISRNDILPDDSILLSIKDFSFCVLSLDRYSHVTFDIDNKLIKTKYESIKYDYSTPIVFNTQSNSIVTTVGENTYEIGKDTV